MPRDLGPATGGGRDLGPASSEPYNSKLGSFGRGMTMAPASAALDALLGQGGKEGEGYFEGLGTRFKQAKAYYDAKNEQARKDNPNSYAGGEIATNILGMAAAPALGAVGAPASFMARSASLAPRMIAGVSDAALMAGLIAQARTADKSDAERSRATSEAVSSPYNLLGVAGPAMEASPQAYNYFRDAANRARTRIMASGSGEAQRVFRETFGSQEAAGEATRNILGKDVARRGRSEVERANEIKHLRDTASAKKGALTDRLTSEGVVVNPNEVARDVVGSRDRMFGEPGSRAETHPQVGMSATELGPHAANADRVVQETVNSMSEASRPIAVTREARGAMAGPEGSRPLYRQSGETGPRGAQRQTIIEEGRQTQPVPSRSTLASEGPPPRSWSTDASIERPPYVPGKAEAPTPPSERLQTDTMRPNPGSEWGVAIDAAPPQIRLANTERAKSAIDAAVNDTVARGYASSTPREAIQQNPGLKFAKAHADALRRAGERAVQTQAADDFAEFMRLKQAQQAAETFRGPATLEQDTAAAGSGAKGQGGHFYPSERGLLNWFLQAAPVKLAHRVRKGYAEGRSTLAGAGPAPRVMGPRGEVVKPGEGPLSPPLMAALLEELRKRD